MITAQHIIRYVVTHIGQYGIRTLAQPAQGRYTYATREEAQQVLNEIENNNDPYTLSMLFRLPLEVRPCECWPGNFDPKSIYFD